ncbi:hypothetical protein LguiB_018518 [Lonicera macranthoides]
MSPHRTPPPCASTTIVNEAESPSQENFSPLPRWASAPYRAENTLLLPPNLCLAVAQLKYEFLHILTRVSE